MNRRAFVTGLGAVFAAPQGVAAQQTRKLYRIGFLALDSQTSGPRVLRDGFRRLGWVEGETIAVEFRFADGNLDRLPALAAELVRLGVDVILTAGTPATQAAQRATTNIPIVFSGVADPLRVGLVPSLAHPGGNITGFTTGNVELSGKRLELLKTAVPNLKRVAVFINPTNAQAPFFRKETEAAAASLSLSLKFVGVATLADVPQAFAAIRSQAEALLILPDPLIGSPRVQVQIAELAVKNRLPSMERDRSFAEVGGLMSYGTNLEGLLTESLGHVDKILRGAKPGELPVQKPTKFELVINLKTAKALGLTIPPSLLLGADQVIE
jgi:putative ABC transport system substrate-binding protein